MINNKLRINSYSSRDFAYEEIREQIVMLKLQPGRRISENEISVLLGISRTPVREAFVRLKEDKLLEVYPQKGTFVSLIDLDYVEEARFIREHLERAIVREACKAMNQSDLEDLEENLRIQEKAVMANDHQRLFELDEVFHQTISKGVNKERIWSVIQQMKAHLNRIRVLSLSVNLDWGIIISQHRQIVSAIKNYDAPEADDIMKVHLTKLRLDQEKLIEEFPDYFVKGNRPSE